MYVFPLSVTENLESPSPLLNSNHFPFVSLFLKHQTEP